MKNLLIKIEYLGTHYKGWQVQKPGIPTIESEIECILRKIFGQQINVKACSRTDSGVHAQGQVANFYIPQKTSLRKLFFSLNSLLPDDITVADLVEVPMDFSARFNSKGKRYLYHIVNSEFPRAIGSNMAWWVRHPIDFADMKQASLALLGKNDFSAFKGRHCQSITPIKTIHKIEFSERQTKRYKEIRILYEGSGFLRNMIRIMSGTLVEVGRGKLPITITQELIEKGKRTKAGITAPAHGLTLDKIFYSPDPFVDRAMDTWNRTNPTVSP